MIKSYRSNGLTAQGKEYSRGLNGLIKQARNKGRKTYYTGKPCNRGHLAKRYTSNSMCIDCMNIIHQIQKQKPDYKVKQRQSFERRYNKQPWLFLYDRCKGRAKRQNIPFDININDIKNIWPLDNICPVLGIKMVPNIGGKSGSPNSPSIDKINPIKGYVKDNIAIISLRANQIKTNSVSPEELRQVAQWLETINNVR